MSSPNYIDVICNPNVKPFTKISLKDIHLITNFNNVKALSSCQFYGKKLLYLYY